MSQRAARRQGNAPGPWFVDSSCIDCDVCRQLAPEIFDESGAGSVVARQPTDPSEQRRAFQALVACPVGAIGATGIQKPSAQVFPEEIDQGVYYCGFTSSDSYGAASFLVRRPEGNFLVDSPRWAGQLVRQIESLGGISDVLLTHRDDVAAAARYQEHFGARVWIHAADRRAAPFATHVFAERDAEADLTLRPGLRAISIPGHTPGSAAFLLEERYLFTGDSLHWSRRVQDLAASEDYCWYSWPKQIESLRRLCDFRFEWVLPGHGEWVHLPASEMRHRLRALVERGGREVRV